MTKKAERKAKKARKKAEKLARKAQAITPRLLDAPPAAVTLMPHAMADPGPSLLETARTRWEHGDWAALLDMDGPALETDPERAKLALLLAAAHTQAGELDQARRLTRQAMLWGCSRTIVSRVLLASTQNSLARVAAALDEDPLPHFEAAIRLVQPQADAPLLARSRRVRELAGMGLLPEAAAALEQELGLVRAAAPALTQDDRLAELARQMDTLRSAVQSRAPSAPHSPPSPTAPPLTAAARTARLERVLGLYRDLPAGRQGNFRYLDVKSLPRTGLHFMRNSLAEILRDGFSFCEWYTEPGCCRQMPCALSGYATEGQDRPMLRMIKSHDFDLADPAFPLAGPMRRLILIRDPLPLLTSWWTLKTLYDHEGLLDSHGIRKSKLNYQHDRHILTTAYRIIDETPEAAMPSSAALAGWLDRQVGYITGFAARWHDAALRDPDGTRILRYHETPQAVLDCVDEIAGSLDGAAHARLEQFRNQRDRIFVERASPFDSQSRRIADYLCAHAPLFERTAETIRTQDRTGLLATA